MDMFHLKIFTVRLQAVWHYSLTKQQTKMVEVLSRLLSGRFHTVTLVSQWEFFPWLTDVRRSKLFPCISNDELHALHYLLPTKPGPMRAPGL